MTSFYKRYITNSDRIIFITSSIALIIALILLGINRVGLNYSGHLYIPLQWLWLIPLFIVLTLIGMYAIQHSPRMGFFTRSYGLYFYIFLALSLLTSGVQYTPFPLIDYYLVFADKLLGFHTLTLLNWTNAHPFIKTIFEYAYNSLTYQLMILPLIMALLLKKQSTNIFLLSAIIAFIIGALIYYFFPTAGPTFVFHSPYFLPEQHATALKFYEIHHRQPLTTIQGGMIAFPSMHVAWACLLIYLCRSVKQLFYPILLLNIVVILSTLFLAWHYLVDVFAGIAVASISIYIARQLLICNASTFESP